MNVHDAREYDPDTGKETPEKIALNRRSWMKSAGIGLGAAGLLGGGGYAWWRYKNHGTDEQVIEGGQVENLKAADYFPPKRDDRFQYGRVETVRAEAARYTNFYEFSQFKHSWNLVGTFKPSPWELVINGLCSKPLKIDMEDFYRHFGRHMTERLYRHRCVEKWAMAIPWAGVPLTKVLEAVSPSTKATHVRFVSFNRPDEAPNQRSREGYPWPYNEGLTIGEAKVDLAFLAVGMYGKTLLRQHGAPIRLVIPWKYGFKSIKSITHIELVDEQPATFWNTLMPRAYPFISNVDPEDRKPWWQAREWMLGTKAEHPTTYLNGYEKEVGHLYPRKSTNFG